MDRYPKYDPESVLPQSNSLDKTFEYNGSAIESEIYLDGTNPNCQVARFQKTVRPRLLVWSAADEDSVKRMVSQYQDYIHSQGQDVSDLDLDQIVHTLSTRRSLLAWRTYAVMACKDLSSLDQMYARPTRLPRTQLSLAFVFTGQGAQYSSMGAGLSAFPAFRESINQSERILKQIGSQWSLHGKLSDTLYST